MTANDGVIRVTVWLWLDLRSRESSDRRSFPRLRLYLPWLSERLSWQANGWARFLALINWLVVARSMTAAFSSFLASPSVLAFHSLLKNSCTTLRCIWFTLRSRWQVTGDHMHAQYTDPRFQRQSDARSATLSILFKLGMSKQQIRTIGSNEVCAVQHFSPLHIICKQPCLIYFFDTLGRYIILSYDLSFKRLQRRYEDE